MVIQAITYSLDKLVCNTLALTPERFIESNTENSWNEYINNTSMQGTWCDAQFVQAVADCQNVAIHITESHENIAGETLIEPHYLAQHPSTTIYFSIQYINFWTSSTWNNIFTIANNLYRYISIRYSVQRNDYLLLTDVHASFQFRINYTHDRH